MSCTDYDPPFVKQLDGTQYAGVNCTCASASMANTDDTCGKEVHSADQLRRWTGDTVGGTTLSQVDGALNAHTSTRLDVRYRLPFDVWNARRKRGEGSILQGGYGVLADYDGGHFDAGNGFRGNHAIYVPPDGRARDPLADGRYPDVYRFNGEVYPDDLLMRFAGHLNLEPRAGQRAILLGNGLVYAAFTRDNDADFRATIRPGGTRFRHYFVRPTQYGLQIRGREDWVTKAGFQLACKAPQLVWERPHGDGVPMTRRSVVEITEGSYAGWWVDSSWSDEF